MAVESPEVLGQGGFFPLHSSLKHFVIEKVHVNVEKGSRLCGSEVASFQTELQSVLQRQCLWRENLLHGILHP